MQMQIESTDKLTSLDGVPCRVWNGITAAGVECLVYVHRIAIREDQDASEFKRELVEQHPPHLTVSIGNDV